MKKIIETTTRITAYIVNYVFHPILMPSYLMLLLVLCSSLFINNPIYVKMSVVKIVAGMTIAIPIISIGIARLISLLLEKQSIQEPYDSIFSHITFIVSYIAVIYAMKNWITFRMSMRLFMAPFFIIILYFIFKRFRVKVSEWSAGIASLISFLYLFSLFGIKGIDGFIVVSLIACGVLGSARMYLNKDNISGIIVGSSVGAIASFASFFIGGIL